MTKSLKDKIEGTGILLLAILAWMAGLWLSLWDQDESAYAGFAREMIVSGDWLIPKFPWSDIHRKPPLHFWSIATGFKLFGYHEFVVRLPALLAMAGTLLLVRFRAVAIFGIANAKAATWILSANLLLPFLVKISVTDSLLLFFETMAVFGLINFIHRPNWKETLWFVLGASGAMLVKGPPVLILTIGMMGVFLVLHPHRMRVLRFHPWFLIPLAALPLFIWGWMAWQTDGGVFIKWMIDWYTVSRISNEVLGQTGPPGYYFAFILLAFLPFTLFLPGAFSNLFKSLNPRKWSGVQIILFAWLLSGWVIYELMRSKLPAYAIGAYPGIALLLAMEWTRWTADDTRISRLPKVGTVVYLVLVTTLSIVLPLLAQVEPTFLRLMEHVSHCPLYAISVLLMVTAIAAVILLSKANYTTTFRILLFQSFSLLCAIWLWLIPVLEPQRSATKQLAEWMSDQTQYQEVISADNYKLPSLPFYLMENGIGFRTNKEPEDWMAALQQPRQILIINSLKWVEMNEEADRRNIHIKILFKIPGWISERGKFTEWYIVTEDKPAE
jgi:4-amino-4-deoxy-L-arabinose transferase-like glycosyltransferase